MTMAEEARAMGISRQRLHQPENMAAIADEAGDAEWRRAEAEEIPL